MTDHQEIKPGNAGHQGTWPNYHGRVLIKKLASGQYTAETSVAVDHYDPEHCVMNLQRMLREIDHIARTEIAAREHADRQPAPTLEELLEASIEALTEDADAADADGRDITEKVRL